MIRRPPRSTRTDTLFPYTTLFRSDLGYLADGEIVITGRAKDLIIVNGRNILPQDLEWTAEGEVAALRSGDVAAFAEHDDKGQRIVGLIEWCSSDQQMRETDRKTRGEGKRGQERGKSGGRRPTKK